MAESMTETPDTLTSGMVALLVALSGLAILVGVGLLASLYAAGWAWWKQRKARRLREQMERWLDSANFTEMEIIGTWGGKDASTSDPRD